MTWERIGVKGAQMRWAVVYSELGSMIGKT